MFDDNTKRKGEGEENDLPGLKERESRTRETDYFAEFDHFNSMIELQQRRVSYGQAMGRIVNSILDKYCVPEEKKGLGEPTERVFFEQLSWTLRIINSEARKFGLEFTAEINEIEHINKPYCGKIAELRVQIADPEKFTAIVKQSAKSLKKEKDNNRRYDKERQLERFLHPLIETLMATDNTARLLPDNNNVKALAGILPQTRNLNGFLDDAAAVVPAIRNELAPEAAAQAMKLFLEYERVVKNKLKMVSRCDSKAEHLMQSDALFSDWMDRALCFAGSATFLEFAEAVKSEYLGHLELLIRKFRQWGGQKDEFGGNFSREAHAFAEKRAEELRGRGEGRRN